MQALNNSNILALDVGHVRIGVAIASHAARLPRPLTTLDASGEVVARITDLVAAEEVSDVVVGLPRGLAGQETEQTHKVMEFTKRLKRNLNVPIHLQDEALTSKNAEQELADRGKKFNKADIDALAATYILEDFLAAKTVGVPHTVSSGPHLKQNGAKHE